MVGTGSISSTQELPNSPRAVWSLPCLSLIIHLLPFLSKTRATPAESRSTRGKKTSWEARCWLARKARPFPIMYLFNVRVHGISVSESFVLTCGIWGCGWGERRVAKKCSPLLGWGKAVRIISTPCWMRGFSLMEYCRIFTSSPRLKELAGLATALFKYASPRSGLLCFRVSV